MTELVEVAVGSEGVATLTLNRPDKRNALNDELISGLDAAVTRCAMDDAARVVVLRGAGPTFCAGADTAMLPDAAEPPSALADRNRLLDERYSCFLRLWDLPKPTIAQIHGHCLAVGVTLGSCCDLVVVAEDATIGWPLPMGGGVVGPTLALHVGMRRAKELSFDPMSTLTGVEAAAIGWANRAVPADELEGFVHQMARRIARVPAGVLRMKKEAINAVYDRIGFREALRAGAAYNALAHTDPEVEGLRARVRDEGIKAASEWFRSGDEER
jgi:enoyl-CoA hydratase/carnithine racemase